MRLLARSAVPLLALAVACSKHDITAPGTGLLQITITGLSGSSAAVQVTGPASFSQQVVSSTTIPDLTPGNYTLTSSNVTATGTTFVPTPTSVSVNVAASTTPAKVTIDYGPTTGSLALAVTGLPGGTNPSILIIGPSGSFSATSASTLSRLAPGTYHLYPASVNNGVTFYDPTVLKQEVAVIASTTPATASITYTVATGLNLYIESSYITQATQSYDGSVPLVKDRDGFLRVFVRANRPNSVAPPVRVRWYSGGTLVRTDLIAATAASVPTAIGEGNLANSWNLHLPASLIQPGLSMLVDVDPANIVPEIHEDDNSDPASGTPLPLAVHTENPFTVTLVPVRTKVDGLTGNVSAGNAESFLGFLQRIHPLPGHSATVHAIYTTTDSTHALQSGDGNGMWETVLAELFALRTAESAPPSLYYYGVVAPSYTGGVAGLGYIGAPVAMGWDSRLTDQILAHEVGHNWGRAHSPGCNAGNPDPTYPNATGLIDNYGLDVSADTVVIPGNAYDVMSYCHPQWTSTFTYAGVMSFREARPAIAGAAAAAAREPALLVWGRLRDGQLVLEPAFEVVARAQLPEENGAYTLEGLDDQGAPLFSYAFAGTEIADAPTAERSFAFTIPLSRFDVTKLRSLRLAGNGREVVRTGGAAVAARRVGAPASARASILGGGRLRVTWDAASYPMALVRDARTGEVLSFARGGNVAVPSSGRVEVTLSDGVRSVRAQQ